MLSRAVSELHDAFKEPSSPNIDTKRLLSPVVLSFPTAISLLPICSTL
jgi:hypothetical protein